MFRPRQRKRLTTWNEIAAYLGVSPRTAQIWEKEEDMPVERIGTGPRARVTASPAKLDRWMEKRLKSSAHPKRLLERLSRFWTFSKSQNPFE